MNHTDRQPAQAWLIGHPTSATTTVLIVAAILAGLAWAAVAVLVSTIASGALAANGVIAGSALAVAGVLSVVTLGAWMTRVLERRVCTQHQHIYEALEQLGDQVGNYEQAVCDLLIATTERRVTSLPRQRQH